MAGLMRRKAVSLEALAPHQRLKPTLSWPHLIPLGVGAIVGTGIYTLIGVGANLAGPGVMLSFAIAGAICACAALAYAEVATMIPASGSAYTYSYVVLGEIIAWAVGWSLILEYSLVVSAVAVGWSGYATGFLAGLGVHLPAQVSAGLWAGGLVNLPAIVIIAVVAALLMLGARESASVNALLVLIKIAALLVFIAVALPRFDAANFRPFMPYGFAGAEIGGVKHGVMAAAAIIFFAFYGFDALSTAAEETRRPARDLPIGIIGSMAVCTLLYIAVAAAAIGAMPTQRFATSPEPLALILRGLGEGPLAIAIGAAAVIALPTVILAFLYGQSRIFFVMARDGLLPRSLAAVSEHGVPVRMTLVTAVVVAALAGLAPLSEIASLANAGTLAAFIAVSVCLLVLRRRYPPSPALLPREAGKGDRPKDGGRGAGEGDHEVVEGALSSPDEDGGGGPRSGGGGAGPQAQSMPRLFRAPLAWIIAPIAIAGCLYLFWNLPTKTKLFFALWNAVGLALYFAWRATRREATVPAV